MLGKSSIFLMLLVVASIVGMSTIYKPANVETQPTPQPTPQPQLPQSALEARYKLGQQQGNEIKLGGQLVDPKIIQSMNDRSLVDRLMPLIIDRLQVTLNFRDNYSPLYKISKDVMASESFHKAEARCPPGFRITGGGGQISTQTKLGDNNIVTLMPIPSSRLQMEAKMETTGEIMAYANCLGFEAIVKLKK
jgi:hypothetical protein